LKYIMTRHARCQTDPNHWHRLSFKT